MVAGSFLMMPVYLMFAYRNVSLLIPVAMMGIAFSLIPAMMWPSVAYIVDEQRLGTAYALMGLIQQVGFVIFNFAVGKANDMNHAGPTNPHGYALGMWIFSILGFLALFSRSCCEAGDRAARPRTRDHHHRFSCVSAHDYG